MIPARLLGCRCVTWRFTHERENHGALSSTFPNYYEIIVFLFKLMINHASNEVIAFLILYNFNALKDNEFEKPTQVDDTAL